MKFKDVIALSRAKRKVKPVRTPKVIHQVKDFIKTINSAKVSKDIYGKRLDICNQCEYLTKRTRCTQCGCFMNKKAQYQRATCPINKWEETKGEENGKKKDD